MQRPQPSSLGLSSPAGDRSPKPRLLYRLRPGSDKPRLQVGRLRLLFRPRGVIQSSDWVVALGLPHRLIDSSPSPRAGVLARGSHAPTLSSFRSTVLSPPPRSLAIFLLIPAPLLLVFLE